MNTTPGNWVNKQSRITCPTHPKVKYYIVGKCPVCEREDLKKKRQTLKNEKTSKTKKAEGKK